MTSKDDEEVVFNAALDHEEGPSRSAFLDAACAGKADLRRRIEQLLSAYGDGENLNAPTSLLARIAPEITQAKSGTIVGNYHLLERIGEGGMGDVFLARRVEGHRQTVALKVIKPGMDSRQVMARFELERTSLAKMDHPQIAKFIEAGVSDQGRSYFVMELVMGLSITEYCDRHRLSVTSRIKLVVDLCLAVEHAHSKGLVHRDLKPGNVLVTEVDGAPIVKVIDFGVAKALDNELNDRTIFTHPSQFLGTPIYMSPEQVRWCPDVDFRSDVYSIGVLLYELLSGSTPIDKAILRTLGLEELRRLIQEEETPRPSERIALMPANMLAALAVARGVSPKQLRLQLRGDLDWITLKALAKDRGLRYRTAGELADDINRHLTHRTVRAGPPSLSVRTRKWARRHSRFLIAAIIVGTALSISLAAYWSKTHYRNNSFAAATSEPAANHLAYCNDMQQAWFRVTTGDRSTALSLLEKHSPGLPGRPDVGFEWHLLHDLAAAKPLHVYHGTSDAVLSADISPDRRWVACGDRSGAVTIWDANTAERVRALHIEGGEATAVKFSPDGKWLAWTGMDRIVHLTKTGVWDDDIQLQKHSATVCSVAWSPDSKWLASSGRDQKVFIWNTEESRNLQDLPGHTDAVRCVAWSPDGKYLATSNGTEGIFLWDTKEWKRLQVLNSAKTGTLCIRFSPDSRRVAFGGYDSVLSEALVDDPKTLMHLATRGQIWSLEYISDSRILAGLGDGKVELIRVVANRPPHNSYLTSEWVTAVKGGGTYRTIASVGNEDTFLVAREQDRAVELVRAVDLLGYRPPRLDSFALGAAGDYLLAYRKASGTAQLWNVHNRDTVQLDLAPKIDCPPAYSAAANLLAIARSDGAICFYDSRRLSLQKSIPLSMPARSMSFSKDGHFLAVGCEQGQLRIIDSRSGEVQPVPLPSHKRHHWVQYSPVDDMLAVAGALSTTVRLLRVPELEQISSFQTGSDIRWLEFSPHGDRLAVAEDHGVSMWDIPSGRAAGLYGKHREPPAALKFSPNGRTIASIDAHSVHIWDASTAHEFCTVPIWGCPGPWLGFVNDKVLLTGDVMTSLYHSFGGAWATDNRFREPVPEDRPKLSPSN